MAMAVPRSEVGKPFHKRQQQPKVPHQHRDKQTAQDTVRTARSTAWVPDGRRQPRTANANARTASQSALPYPFCRRTDGAVG